MFKFYTKGDTNNLEAAVFYNGQRIMTLYAWHYTDNQITVEIRDGNDDLQAEWVDYEESY